MRQELVAFTNAVLGDARQEGGELLKALESAFPVQAIRTRAQHECTVAVIEKVMAYLAQHENDEALCRDVRTYLESLAIMVEAYERQEFPDVGGKKLKGVDMLKYLMEVGGLTQADLRKEIGPQPNVSAVLRGSRKLNARQIAALAKRFKVSPALFFDL
jgi:antitoxin component HigA of HigAB toxin-antitoxin module